MRVILFNNAYALFYYISSFAEQKMFATNNFLLYVESLEASNLSEMLATRIIPSFIQSVRHHDVSAFSDFALKCWYVDMTIAGMKGSTSKRYIGAIHNLYAKWLESHPDAEDFSSSFKQIASYISNDNLTENLKRISDNYNKISTLTKYSSRLKGERLIANCVFQFLFYNPMISMSDLVKLKFSDQIPELHHLKDIVLSMKKMPQAKYVFPLQQGKKREPAIIRDLVKLIHTEAKSAGMNFGTNFSRDSIKSLWIYSALQLDIPIPEILSIVKVLPEDYKFLSVFDPTELSAEEEEDIMCRVADHVNSKSLRWFVMKLRSGVSPDDIKEKLHEQKSPLLNTLKFFYPLKETKKIDKKKVITIEIPYLPGILFFRLATDKVSSLMSSVGELAWCYRTSASPSSPYSAISQKEMKAFQRCIGSFTSDIEMELVSSLPELNIGDEVIIEDGSMLSGQQATIHKIRSVDGSVTYSLRLSDTAFIRWKEISLSASHLTKVYDKVTDSPI